MLGNEPREYADAILNVCKHYVKSPVVCVSGIIGADLKRRIIHIMARHIGQRLTPGRKLLLGGATAVAIAIPLALGMTGILKAGTQGTKAHNGQLPSFEVASIKLDKSRAPLVGHHLLDGYYRATTNVTELIMDAYGQYMRPLNPDQVLEGPVWIMTDVYDINAKVSDSILNGEWKKLSFGQRWNEAMLMLRSLLINRFKLRVRRETKVLPVFELVLAKNVPKVTEDKNDNQPCQISEYPRGKDLELELDVKSCAFDKVVGFLRFPELKGRARADKTGLHGRPQDIQLRRLLLDKTGLRGRYSFKLHWTPHIYTPPGTPKPSGPSLFAALREQLGLKIVSGKAPVNILVIEHIERPTPN
jgi:bla regulator protein blaR1